jgi:hypothetical protein
MNKLIDKSCEHFYIYDSVSKKRTRSQASSKSRLHTKEACELLLEIFEQSCLNQNEDTLIVTKYMGQVASIESFMTDGKVVLDSLKMYLSQLESLRCGDELDDDDGEGLGGVTLPLGPLKYYNFQRNFTLETLLQKMTTYSHANGHSSYSSFSTQHADLLSLLHIECMMCHSTIGIGNSTLITCRKMC